MAAGTDLLTWSARIERALSGCGVQSVFQPIVDLQRGEIAGYEALTRFDEVDGQYFSPDVWFRAAAALGLTAELDAVTLRSAFAARAAMPRNSFLSVNVDPESLSDRVVTDVFLAQGNLGGVVIEITEHREWNWTKLAPAVERLRLSGAIFAVDDAGSGYSGLQQILQLRPSILKLDRAIVDGVDQDEAKRALIEMLGIFASRLDAWILAEGVETAAEAQTLIDLEVPLVQGFYFCRPQPAWPEIDPLTRTELRQVPRVRQDTLHHLIDPVPSIVGTHSLAQDFVGMDSEWAAVVDDGRRPVGVVNAEAAASNVVANTLVANIHSSPRDVGQRIATFTASEPCAPILVVDNMGSYVGLVTMRRLIRALSTANASG